MPKINKNGVEPPHQKDIQVQLEEFDDEEDMPGDEDNENHSGRERFKPLQPQHSD